MFFFNNTYGLSFYFYLYSVRDENKFCSEKFEKSFFCFLFIVYLLS
jgi:hypothetical protein